ncbi:MAG TPA: GNAT family N-acetyltransferase, partial [Anaerolineae bacterium]
SADSQTDLRGFKNLPYTDPDESTSLEMTQQYSDRVRRFVARLDGKVVGQSVVFLTSGPYGAAGIYDVGVAPEARKRGIGKAVVQAACHFARERGYQYAVLNATGRRMYEQLGFQWLGDGWTWWLNIPRLAAYQAQGRLHPTIAFTEAIGRGDIEALNDLGANITHDQLRAPLANEMTLMQLAVHLRQSASAEWLVAHGVTMDVLSAWDLGQTERAAMLLAGDPSLVNQRYGEQKLTLMHEAVARGDMKLARLALSAHPDLTAQDDTYHSTPLGWARHLARAELIELIEQHSAE